MKSKLIILIADDDENDRTLLQHAIKRSRVPADTREVHDGQEVIHYLQGEGQYSDRLHYPFPHLLIVDLKMPRMNGLEVLDWMRTHPECQFLPAIMLSGSELAEDVTNVVDSPSRCLLRAPSNGWFVHSKENLESWLPFQNLIASISHNHLRHRCAEETGRCGRGVAHGHPVGIHHICGNRGPGE